MKKQQVDTPYENSWADQMKRGSLELVKPQTHPTVLGLKNWVVLDVDYTYIYTKNGWEYYGRKVWL